MSEKDSKFWNDVIKLGLMLGSLWLGAEFLKSI
jgi:hypothetical protein